MHSQHLIDEMTERLKELKPRKVILFGSYAKGMQTEDSEIVPKRGYFLLKEIC
jgi:predicted nucleotidyltransferase